MTRKSESFIVTKKKNPKTREDYYNLLDHSVLDKFLMESADKSTKEKQPISKQVNKEGEFYLQFKQPAYDLKELCTLLEQNTYHKDCCEVVAEDASAYTWNIVPVADINYEPKPEGKKKIVDWINNFTISPNTLFFEVNYDKRAMGSGAVELIREGKSDSKPIDLQRMNIFDTYKHKDGCRIMQEGVTERKWFIEYGKNIDKNGEKYDVHCETGRKYPYNSLPAEERANEVIWLRQYAPHMDNYGLAKIIPAIRAVYGDLGRSEYNNKFFENYGMPSFALTVTGDFQDYDVDPNDPEYDETQTLRYRISQQLQEVIDNPHSAVTILVPSVGDEGNVHVNLQPLSVNTQEASFRMYRSDNREEVMAAHRVPPYRLGLAIQGELGGNISNESSNIYNTSTIQPLRKEDESIINNILRKEFGVTEWEFKLVDIDNRNVNEELSNAELLFRMGALTPRELIETFGKPYGAVAPIDDHYLDERFINGTPIKRLFADENPDPNQPLKNDYVPFNPFNEGERKQPEPNTTNTKDSVDENMRISTVEEVKK